LENTEGVRKLQPRVGFETLGTRTQFRRAQRNPERVRCDPSLGKPLEPVQGSDNPGAPVVTTGFQSIPWEQEPNSTSRAQCNPERVRCGPSLGEPVEPFQGSDNPCAPITSQGFKANPWAEIREHLRCFKADDFR
jgi:hypothetical protein